ncbi:MAG: hypothetical protein LCH69_16040 [Proteobacteria bacterium]|nr:hypothetical protein [Pseudomonadota bacterium]
MPLVGTMPIPASTRRMLRAVRYARILLVLWSAFAFSLAGGPGTHGMAVAQTLVSVIICGEEGPEMIQMDTGGNPAEHSGDCSRCASCLNHHLAALSPHGFSAERSLARRRAGQSHALGLRRPRTVSHFLATGPPARQLSPGLSFSAGRVTGEASPGLTIVNTKSFGTWQGSGRSAKEAGR